MFEEGEDIGILLLLFLRSRLCCLSRRNFHRHFVVGRRRRRKRGVGVGHGCGDVEGWWPVCGCGKEAMTKEKARHTWAGLLIAISLAP